MPRATGATGATERDINRRIEIELHNETIGTYITSANNAGIAITEPTPVFLDRATYNNNAYGYVTASTIGVNGNTVTTAFDGANGNRATYSVLSPQDLKWTSSFFYSDYEECSKGKLFYKGSYYFVIKQGEEFLLTKNENKFKFDQEELEV